MYVGSLGEFITRVAYDFDDGIFINTGTVSQRGVCVSATIGDKAAGIVCMVDSQFFHQGVKLALSPVVDTNSETARAGDQVVFLASRKVKGKHIRHYL